MLLRAIIAAAASSPVLVPGKKTSAVDVAKEAKICRRRNRKGNRIIIVNRLTFLRLGVREGRGGANRGGDFELPRR